MSAIVAGFVFVSSAGAATVSVSKGNALLDAALLNDLGAPAAALSGVLPDGGEWFTTSYVPAPGKTSVTGNVVNTYKSPWSGSAWQDTAKYWTTGTNGAPNPNAPNPGVLVFDHQHTSLSMLWGSVDLYNSISFYLAGALIDTITGADILALDGNIQQGAGAVLVNFLVSGGTFDRLVFSSTSNAFEVSNLEVNDSQIPGVPLPSALLLLGSVVGGLGFFGSRRKAVASFG